MTSGRIQQIIDNLIAEAAAALAENDWPRLRARANAILALDPKNEDAQTLLEAAARAGGVAPHPADGPGAGASGGVSAPHASRKPSAPADPPVDLKALHAKIGKLALENDFLEGALSKAGLLSAKR